MYAITLNKTFLQGYSTVWWIWLWVDILGIAGAPVAFKTWCGHYYRVGIICPPLVEIGLR